MDTYFSLHEQLERTGLYALPGNSPIDAELRAYAEGFEVVRQRMDERVQEGSPVTAQDWGLERYGFLKGIPPSADVEQKRRALLARCAMTADSFTVEGTKQILEAFACTCEILEQPPNDVHITILEAPAGLLSQPVLSAIATEYLPSHLSYTFDLGPAPGV